MPSSMILDRDDFDWADDAIAAAKVNDQVAILSMEWEPSELLDDYISNEKIGSWAMGPLCGYESRESADDDLFNAQDDEMDCVVESKVHVSAELMMVKEKLIHELRDLIRLDSRLASLSDQYKSELEILVSHASRSKPYHHPEWSYIHDCIANYLLEIAVGKYSLYPIPASVLDFGVPRRRSFAFRKPDEHDFCEDVEVIEEIKAAKETRDVEGEGQKVGYVGFSAGERKKLAIPGLRKYMCVPSRLRRVWSQE